jgi:adenosine deaminase CECR1
MVGTPSMSLHGWRQLAEWSIEYSCLSDTDKRTAREIFAKDWEAFCVGIVADYGKDVAELDIALP